VQPIKETQLGLDREARVASYLTTTYPWVLTSTPKFYFTDYHINERNGLQYENYIGDLEIKWLNTPSSERALFSFSKVQQMSILPLYKDLPNAAHRVLFRFTDGLLMLPVDALQTLKPFLFRQNGPDELTKLVVQVQAKDYLPYFKPIIIR
jgi:hypothetical protein